MISPTGSTGASIYSGSLVQGMHQNTDVFDVSVDNAFDFLSEEYAALFGGSAATAFQHPLWLDSIYTRLAPAAAAKRLIIVLRYRATGALAMVLPLLRVRRGPIWTVEFADLRVSDYLALPCSAKVFSEVLGDEKACLEIRRLIKPFDLLRIPKLPGARTAIESLLGAPPCVAMETNAYSVVLQAPFEQWRASALERSYQKELAKKRRQLERKGALRFSCCEDSPAIVSALEVMKGYRGPRFQSRGDGDLLQRPEYFDFYSDIAVRGAGSFARLYALRMDDRVIAAVLGLCHMGTFLIIMSAFDVEGYKSQSLGALMFEQVAKDCIERGDQVLDFTIGDEPYKKLFGAQPSPMWTVTQTGSAVGTLVEFALKQAPWVKLAAKRMAGFKLLPVRT
jgi:CelD/BcsL family acetyltransferase involved in cellulose biosynthesis